ncbi:MAG TPA: HyaD/HybD family hydrogenase maturation endopeptidase [Vicinamibacterales bacterium]
MNSTRADLLVLGLGNVLLSDDAVGPAAVAHLRRSYLIPDGVLCLDGGTLGLSLLPYLEDARKVILVDAVLEDGPPGTLVRLRGSDVGPAVATRLSPHQIGVADMLQGARWHDREPAQVVLLGIVPQSIELGAGLSAPVAASMSDLIDMICAEAAACGHQLWPKASFEIDFDIARWLEGPRV